jgi:hypothetical protein
MSEILRLAADGVPVQLDERASRDVTLTSKP